MRGYLRIRAKQYFVLHAPRQTGKTSALIALRDPCAWARVVNGGGRIEREYGLGRSRTDLLVLWPNEAGQPSDLWQRFVVECKVLRDSDRKSLAGVIDQGRAADVGLHGEVPSAGRPLGGDRSPRCRPGGRRRWSVGCTRCICLDVLGVGKDPLFLASVNGHPRRRSRLNKRSGIARNTNMIERQTRRT